MTYFDVEGDPVSQGSMVAVGAEGHMRHSSGADLTGWRDKIGFEANRHFPTPFDGALAVSLQFRLRRPNSIRDREHPYVVPDVDKLARAVLDALEGIAYHNDSRVCLLVAEKSYCAPGETPGVSIDVYRHRTASVT